VRRLLGIQKTPPGERLTKVADDLPRDSLFAQPLVCDVVGSAETHDDDHRVSFKVTVKDAEGKRCPDIFVAATVSGPERTASGETTTNMLGTATFRMAGPAGEYAIRVTDVAAGALDWDRATSTAHLEVTLP
jgi:hypothetical protein